MTEEKMNLRKKFYIKGFDDDDEADAAAADDDERNGQTDTIMREKRKGEER